MRLIAFKMGGRVHDRMKKGEGGGGGGGEVVHTCTKSMKSTINFTYMY